MSQMSSPPPATSLLNPPSGDGTPAGESTLHSILSTQNPFRNRWYAVAPVNDLPRDRPYGIELFNTALVVFYDQSKDAWTCLLDRCRHRCSALSCGSVSETGTLTCLYHGWQYDGEGYCVNIPSVPNFHRSEKLKVDHFRTHISGRILWVFAGRPEDADVATLPPMPWSDPRYMACMFVRDTEFDWLIYNEHNADRYHLNFAHANTLKFVPVPLKPAVRIPATDPLDDGIHYKQEQETKKGERRESLSSFYPPSTVVARQELNGLHHGISFIVTPLAYGRCRVIFLLYRSKKMPVPAFMLHIVFARVTEEDAVLVRSQMKQLSAQNLTAEEAFFNVGADNVARDYREWLRRSGALFWQREVNHHVKDYSAVQARTLAPASSDIYQKWEGNLHLISRDAQHFRICRTCQTAHRRFTQARIGSAVLATLTLASFLVWNLTPASGLLRGFALVIALGGAVLSTYVMQLLRGKRF